MQKGYFLSVMLIIVSFTLIPATLLAQTSEPYDSNNPVLELKIIDNCTGKGVPSANVIREAVPGTSRMGLAHSDEDGNVRTQSFVLDMYPEPTIVVQLERPSGTVEFSFQAEGILSQPYRRTIYLTNPNKPCRMKY